MGTYNLNGGLLTGSTGNAPTPSGLEVVGVSGTGIFNQSGGTNLATDIPLCRRPHREHVLFRPLYTAPVNPAYGTYTPQQRAINPTGTPGRGANEYMGCGWHGDLHADGRNQPKPRNFPWGKYSRL